MDAFKTALRMLSRFSLATAERPVKPVEVMAWLVLVGLAEGVCYACLAALIMWLTGGGIGGVISALAILSLSWYFTEGTKVKGFIRFLESLRGSSADVTGPYLQITCFQGAMLLKAACIAVLVASGHGLWLILPPVLSAAALAELVMVPAVLRDRQENFPVWLQARHWFIALALCIVVGGLMTAFAAGVTAAVLGWLLVPALVRLVQRVSEAGPGDAGRRAIMEFVEMVILVLGVLTFTGK